MHRLLPTVLLVLLGLQSTTQAQKAQLEGVVNLNTASPEELRLIPGVGASRVRNILAYRRNHPFRTVEELARIKGIGRKTVRRWRQHLAVSGPSTAQKVVRPAQPFVGPPLLPPSPRPTQMPPPPAAVRTLRPPARRGEPAHRFFPPSPANACLPPP